MSMKVCAAVLFGSVLPEDTCGGRLLKVYHDEAK